MSTDTLTRARTAHNDEYYTRRRDIERELKHYRDQFRGRAVYCNCDDPERSQFWAYFRDNFAALGLSRLTATHYTPRRQSAAWVMESADRKPHKYLLNEDGDFRSDECRALMEQADVVVTNPPFSLFRQYIAQVAQSGRLFCVIAPMANLTSAPCFGLLQNGRAWAGRTHGRMVFTTPYPDKPTAVLGSTCWVTNMTYSKDGAARPASASYRAGAYERFANYDAINVNRVKDIPSDYPGTMGVPITYLLEHDPARYEILGRTNKCSEHMIQPLTLRMHRADGTVDAAKRYMRGAFIQMPAKPCGGTYYEADGRYYRHIFARVLIRRRRDSGVS